ncbi:MAG: AAA family ATPase [Pirellulaceae bacterium]|nr:AAA family ATPase [Pirellulaceae bacterium]
MIDRVRIQNFKCLLETTVDLGPLTVLIGPNDSGKTSFLEALRMLGATTERALTEVFHDDAKGGRSNLLPSLVWRRERHLSIGWHVQGKAKQSFEYGLCLPVDGQMPTESLAIDGRDIFRLDDRDTSNPRNPSHDPNRTFLNTMRQLQNSQSGVRGPHPDRSNEPVVPVDWVCEALGSTEEYRFVPDAMRSASKAEPNPTLSTTGDNLAAVLNSLLTGPDRAAVVELEGKLREAIPTLQGLSTPAADSSGSLRQIEFALSGPSKPPETIPSSQASDGAMLLTAFLALAYGNTPQILLIEEPENGLHPSRLQMVIEILRKMSRGEVGNQPRQIILTTHSPLLLNFVQPEEVRIFQRAADGATRVTPMDQIPNIERLHKEYAAGELWYLFGEEELVKGQSA